MRRSKSSAPLFALPLIPLVTLLLASGSAGAFSRIEGSEGSTSPRSGIIAVPLPPLPAPAGTQNDIGPIRPAEEPEGTDAGERPLSPEDERRIDREPSVVPTGPSNAPGDDRTGADAPATRGDATRGRSVRPNGLQPSARPAVAQPLPAEIGYADEGLPGPVADLRTRLMEIARSGDIEKLRPYLQTGEEPTVLSFGDVSSDPIEFLKSASGDGEGVEILAIMLEVLEAGHAHVQAGDDEEIYVWPYFTQKPIDDLSRRQLVELFELVTAGDYETMKAFGAYNFYRLGITPDGRLQFFVAGD